LGKLAEAHSEVAKLLAHEDENYDRLPTRTKLQPSGAGATVSVEVPEPIPLGSRGSSAGSCVACSASRLARTAS